MEIGPFLHNLATAAIAALAGAGVLAGMTLIVQPWRAALRSWWYMTVLFFLLGAIGAFPSLLTGDRFGTGVYDRDCTAAKYGC